VVSAANHFHELSDSRVTWSPPEPDNEVPILSGTAETLDVDVAALLLVETSGCWLASRDLPEPLTITDSSRRFLHHSVSNTQYTDMWSSLVKSNPVTLLCDTCQSVTLTLEIVKCSKSFQFAVDLSYFLHGRIHTGSVCLKSLFGLFPVP
jgi:hypothetical protein